MSVETTPGDVRVRSAQRVVQSGGRTVQLRSPEALRDAMRAMPASSLRHRWSSVGMTAVALADAAGCSPSMIHLLRSGKRMTLVLTLAEGIAAALQVPLSALFVFPADTGVIREKS